MQQLIIILHVLVAFALVILVLLQYGKGAAVGAAFGSGASNTMFGSVGSAPFLVKITGLLAAVFFATSMVLAHQAMVTSHSGGNQSIVNSIPTSPSTAPITVTDSNNSAVKNTEVERGKKK